MLPVPIKPSRVFSLVSAFISFSLPHFHSAPLLPTSCITTSLNPAHRPQFRHPPRTPSLHSVGDWRMVTQPLRPVLVGPFRHFARAAKRPINHSVSLNIVDSARFRRLIPVAALHLNRLCDGFLAEPCAKFLSLASHYLSLSHHSDWSRH